MHLTKTDEALATAEREHAGDPERAELLSRARRFKASWIELAEGLTEVRKGAWKKWGYSTFEDYTKKELHLRQETVDKLTGSYLFLQRSAPEVLSRNGVGAPIPSYQSVDFLRRAEEKEGAPVTALKEIRQRVLDDAAPLPAITRKYQEVVFPLDESEKQEKDTAAIRGNAKRLRDLLEQSDAVPKRLALEVKGALDRLLEAVGGGEAEGA